MGSNIDFLMKQLVGIIFIFISLQTVGQSKKKQILFLNQKVDSLQTLLNVERTKSEEKLTNARVQSFNLQEKITSLETQITETKKLLKESETALSSKNQINKEQQDLINKLKEELQVKEDSLDLLRSEQDIQLLPDNFFVVSDNELIKLFSVKDSDLGENFVSKTDLNLRPKYSIIGRQFFSLEGRVYLLAIMGVDNPNDDHVYVGTSFIACFKLTKSKLILFSETFNTIDYAYGEFGSPPRLEKFLISGKKLISVSLISFYTGMGYDLQGRSLFSLDKNMNFHVGYNEQSHEDDSGNQGSDDWENIDTSFEIDFKPNKDEYFYLEEREYSHDKLKNTRLLRFNPSTNKYEPVK